MKNIRAEAASAYNSMRVLLNIAGKALKTAADGDFALGRQLEL
jgi:hypothetical protein